MSCSLLDQLWVCSEYYSNMSSVETSVRASVRASVRTSVPKSSVSGWTARSGQTPNAKRTPNLIKHILHQSTTFLLTVSLNILTFCHGVQFWPIFRRLSRKSNWPNVANVCPGNRIGQTSIIHSVWGDENYCTAIDVPTDPPRCSNSPPFTEKQCSL